MKQQHIMKIKSILLTFAMVIGFVGNVYAQKDITNIYITNASLSNGTTGWTVNNFKDPKRGNNTIGYATEAYAGWDNLDITTYSLTQDITLQPGHYRLVNYSFFRQSEAYNSDKDKSLAYLKAGNTQKAISTLGSIPAASYANSQVEGANCFDAKMYRNFVEFTIDTDNTTIEIGIVGTFDIRRSWCIVGMFELFDLNDAASYNSPTDVTYTIANSGFEYRNADEWTSNDGGGYADNENFGSKAGVGFVERWQSSNNGGLSNGTFTQTLTNLPSGLYEVSVYAQNIEQQNGSAAGRGMYVTANNARTEISANNQYKVRTTVTDGQLTLGIQLDGCTGNWIAFDRFGLLFYGDPLEAYKDQLAAKVEEAQALVNGGTLRSGAATQLQNVINDNDNDDNAFTEEAQFDVAISNLEQAINQATAIAAAYPAYDTFRAKAAALADNVATCESKTAFLNALTTADAAVDGATSVEAVAQQTAAVRSAITTFISTTEGSFDITFLASQNYWDWKKKDGSAAGIVADQFLTGRPADIPSFAESYEDGCTTTGTVLYQTVSNLPEGYYQVGMYAQALYTPGRGFSTEATEGDANRSFAFAGDQRTGLPIKFATAVAFADLTTLDVNVHLTTSGDLTFGVQKDANGSNWHFAQIASIVYSNTPDLTNLKATRDSQVAEAEGILNSADANYLTVSQQQALQSAIDEAIAANTFETLNTVTLTNLPNAIQTARQQIAQAKANRVEMIAALERFERDYNLVDGTDYARTTMSAEAWTKLLEKVNAVSLALDDLSQIDNYGDLKDALNAQMDATDASILLFKQYKAMVEGTTALGIFTETEAMTDTDAAERTAIGEMNTAFTAFAASQSADFDVSAFLGENLDFNTPQGDQLTTVDIHKIFDIVGWEEAYANLDANCFIENSDASYNNMLYLRSNWTSQPVELRVFKKKMLPVGKYKLTFKWNSNLQNMTPLSQYQLGETATAIGKATSDMETLEYDFEITDAATPFDLTFGLRKQNSGNTPAQILVDDVTLTCIVTSEFQIALDAARGVTHAATTSAVEQFAAYEGHEGDFESSEARQAAISILRNAKTIADNGGLATTLIQNADFTGATVNGTVQGSGGQVAYPGGWNFVYQYDGWNDTKVIDDNVFNAWAATIHRAELSQAISYLPNGAYRLTGDVKTDTNASSSHIALYGLDGSNVGRSNEVGKDVAGDAGAFASYSCAFDVIDNAATIGIRSDMAYYQLKNLQLEYIGATATEETAASYLRQDYYWNGSTALWYDATAQAYAPAKNVVVYPQEPNQLIVASATDQFADATNKIVNGVCASFVLTDRNALSVEEAFTAENATYSRTLAQDDAAYTVFLPYALSSNDDVQFYALASYRSDGLHFNEVDVTEPMTPYLAIANNNASLNATNVEVAVTASAHEVTADGYTMKGSLSGMNRDEAIADNAYIMQSNNEWKKVGESSPQRPIPTFRAYISAPANAANTFSTLFDGLSTIETVSVAVGLPEGAVFDIQGRKVADSPARLSKGIYIINGKKYVVK